MRPGRRILAVAGLSLIIGATLIGCVTTMAGLLPGPSDRALVIDRLPEASRIYDRHGQLLAEIHRGSDRRVAVPLSQVAPAMVRATISIEDRSFYSHPGLDIGRIVKAAADDISSRHIQEGGSTITQQLVKRLYFDASNRTFGRKFGEALLAVQLERNHSKDEILAAYLNSIYYGNQAYGVEAAAESYFGIHAAQLDTAQAAMLAGIPAAPSRYDPTVDPRTATERQRQVLDAMVANGELTTAERDRAAAEPLTPRVASEQVLAPHFVQWVTGQLEAAYGAEITNRGGLSVTTTLDYGLQTTAEKVVGGQITGLAGLGVSDGALVAMDPRNGEVLAMVGGAGATVPGARINMALSPRQPGSSFKIFTYTEAIDSQKFSELSRIADEPLSLDTGGGAGGLAPWTVTNYDHRYHGCVTLPVALGNSLNIPAVKVELTDGVAAVAARARRMGVGLAQADSAYGPSLTLGGYEVPLLDMATGAATLASLGVEHRPTAILEIRDRDGHPIESYDPSVNQGRAVSPQAAFILSSILADNANRQLEFGAVNPLVLARRTAAAKTGTTTDFRDNLTVGWTPDLVTAVWVGNADHSPMGGVTGITGAAPIWHDFMQTALGQAADSWYPIPTGLHQVDLGGGHFGYVIPGTETASAACSSSGGRPGGPGAGSGHGHGGDHGHGSGAAND